MANRAYASLWCRGWSADTTLASWEKMLATAPFAEGHKGFTSLTVRAIGPAEPELVEINLRNHPLNAADLVALARERGGEDLSDAEFETSARWDAWVFDTRLGRCRLHAEPLGIVCRGEAYDDGIFRERGHIEVDAGFEHLFTGHARVLGREEPGGPGGGEHPIEEEFLQRMKDPELRLDYLMKTRENIRKLFEWVRKIEEGMALEKYRLWSEGEENFEARLDEILALR